MEGRESASRQLNTEISTLELKKLLFELRDRRPDICVRFRLMGQMWQQNFCRIFMLAERGLVLVDQSTNAAEIIPDLAEVIQFEIDTKYQHYQPNTHYSVNTNDYQIHNS